MNFSIDVQWSREWLGLELDVAVGASAKRGSEPFRYAMFKLAGRVKDEIPHGFKIHNLNVYIPVRDALDEVPDILLRDALPNDPDLKAVDAVKRKKGDK